MMSKLKLNKINMTCMISSLISAIVYYILGVKKDDSKKKKIACGFLALFAINALIELETDFKPVDEKVVITVEA